MPRRRERQSLAALAEIHREPRHQLFHAHWQEGELILNANVSHNSGYFFEQDNRLEQPEFQLVNASVEYRFTKNWGVELWGNNLTDEKYWTTVLGSGFGDHGELRPPRTYGVNFTFDY